MQPNLFILPILTALLLVATTHAQVQPTPQLTPVDQAVDDLDPLATSLRRIEPGLGSQPQQSTLFQIRQPLPLQGQPLTPTMLVPQPVYYHITPGVTARVGRTDYLVAKPDNTLGLNIAPRRDGEFLQFAGPNTIFQLSAQPSLPTALPTYAPRDYRLQPVMSYPQSLVDHRVNPYRIDTRLDLRVDYALPRPATSHTNPP